MGDVEKSDNLKTVSTLTVDAIRSLETKRYLFPNGDTSAKVELKYSSNGRFCTDTLTIVANENYWDCRPDNATTYISISEPIKFELSQLKRSLNNDQAQA